MISKKSLGKLIQKRRQELSLTQSDLALSMGPEMRQSWISQFEKGVRKPNYRHLKELCSALKMNVHDIVNQDDNSLSQDDKTRIIWERM